MYLMESLPFQFQKRPFWEFFCPVCKAQRRSFYWPSPRLKHYISLSIFAILITLIMYPFFGMKGFVVNLPIWVVFEFVYRARARQSLICPHCGFDPYLYKHDVKLARQKMDEFFEEKRKAQENQKTLQNQQPTTENPKKEK